MYPHDTICIPEKPACTYTYVHVHVHYEKGTVNGVISTSPTAEQVH